MRSMSLLVMGGGRAAAFMVLLLGLTSPLARAGELDLRGWLERPGTRLVAVEFYATWCGPCMKAVPRWKELHEKYRSKGLRLIVVNTYDPEGACVSPGWNPDHASKGGRSCINCVYGRGPF